MSGKDNNRSSDNKVVIGFVKNVFGNGQNKIIMSKYGEFDRKRQVRISMMRILDRRREIVAENEELRDES